MADISSEGVNVNVQKIEIKFKIEYSWARKLFIMSNMDYCLPDLTSDGVNEYVENVHD